MSDVLVVVDMQNDFLLEDGALSLGHNTEALRKRVADRIRKHNGAILATADNHARTDVEFQQFPPHCLAETSGADFCNEVKQALNEHITDKQLPLKIVNKKSYTGAGGEIQEEILNLLSGTQYEDLSEKDVEVAGVCTHICVHDVIADMVNHFKNRQNQIPQVYVDKNLVDDLDERAAEFALARLHNLYGVEIFSGE